MKEVLFVSNGHGEDTVACRVIDALRSDRSGAALTLDAWPMVGAGVEYDRRGLELVGARNLLPSGGFATISWRLLWRDLAAGWIATHARQVQAARALRGRYRLIVAVGDIVPITASILARTPFLFIGCAKSSYYSRWHGYTGLEKALLRHYCRLTFPRDRLTVAELERSDVATRYVGNPMMDGLAATGEGFGIGLNKTAIALLPGSRDDAITNALDMLAFAGATVERHGPGLCFLLAAHDRFDVEAFAAAARARSGTSLWRFISLTPDPTATGVVLRLRGPAGADFLVARGRFPDVLHRASVAVGMAGTACEQAIGVGTPLIAVPSSGVQGSTYVAMKQIFYGDAAVTVERDPERVSSAIMELLADPTRRARMIEMGRERMGGPGASSAIAQTIVETLMGLRETHASSAQFGG